MTEFGHLPPEVVEEIISRCDLSALLTLRLVSKSLKDAVDSSARFKDALEDVEIILNSSTLQTFVDSAPSSIPFANFSFKFEWTRLGRMPLPEFYRNTPHLQKFKDTFSPRIRKLRVSQMFGCTFDAELDFFRSLESLKELEIHGLIPLTPEDCPDSEEDSQFEVKPPRVPFHERNWKLKRLVVECEENSEDYLIEWIRRCASLEVIQIPWSTGIRKAGIGLYGPGRHGVMRHREFYPYILRLGAEGHLQHLRTLDLNRITMKMDVCSPEDLRYFREMAADKKIRLKRLLCCFLHILRDQFSLEVLRNLWERIVSFNGVSQLLKWEGLVNLQDLEFSSIWMNGRIEWNIDLEPMALPALRKITAHIFPAKDKVEEIQDFLEGLLRPDTPRQSVTDVSMSSFSSDGSGGDHLRAPRIGPHHLDAAFPNLTRLTFRTDRFSREELCQMIEVISRKPQLEELDLSTSNGIPEEAFFGRNNSSEFPVFLKLAKLKKLRLQATPLTWHAIDVFERMGDAMLEKILSKMSLTHLKIIGSGWDGLTSGGIESLVDGPFGRSVLWVRLECVEPKHSQSGIHSSCLERLARVAHGNRVAKGRTFTSFEQFKTSDEASLRNRQRFRNRRWID